MPLGTYSVIFQNLPIASTVVKILALLATVVSNKAPQGAFDTKELMEIYLSSARQKKKKKEKNVY